MFLVNQDQKCFVLFDYSENVASFILCIVLINTAINVFIHLYCYLFRAVNSHINTTHLHQMP